MIIFLFLGISGYITFKVGISAEDPAIRMLDEYYDNNAKSIYDEISKVIGVSGTSKILKIDNDAVMFKNNDNIYYFLDLKAIRNMVMELVPNLNNASVDFDTNLCVTEIPINRIKYFVNSGDLQYTTEISGGGSSLTGAVVGGVIAGGTGAIIGSRKQIHSEIIEHDTRKTILKYFSEENKLVESVFSYKAFSALEELIPEKEYNIVIAEQAQKKSKVHQTSNTTIKKKLKELELLKDENLITADEYNIKRKNIIDEI